MVIICCWHITSLRIKLIRTFITLGSKCYCRWDLYYARVQKLLQMGPLLHLGPKVITDGTFITLGSKCYYRWDLYYAWVQKLLQMGPLLHLGPKVITDGTFITLGSIYYTCAFYMLLNFNILNAYTHGVQFLLSYCSKANTYDKF